MKNYRQLVKELPSKKVVFAFGRFQPPTTGHELLVNAVKKLAGTTADHVIYASKTEDKKSNPLPVARKVYFLKRMFPKTNFVAASAEVRTPIEAAKELNKKYKNIVLVAGSDRVASFQKLLNDYNGKEYHFDTIEVVSAGERDPDSDTASGMSGTKMREAAVAGDFNKFKKGLPHTLTELDGRRLMNDIRKGLGHPIIKEQFIVLKDNLREKYFNGEIFNVGDIVESSDVQYEIVKRGSNHLLLKQEDGSLVSKWIQDVTLVEEIKMNEELSDKTIKVSDKIKVARIIANTLGVENAEATSDPTQLVNAGLRKVRGKAFNADSLKIIGKMLELASEVGIKYDNNLVPTKLKEGVIQPNGTDKIDVVSSAPTTSRTKTVYYKDFKNMLQKEAIVDKKDNESDQDTEARAKAHPHAEVGSAMTKDTDTSNIRRQKIKYRLGEEVELDESAADLDKHISTFGKGVKSSAAKQSTYKRDNKPIHNMKHVETDSDHHAVFKHLQKMGYKKTSGYDSKPNEFDMHHNRDEMTSKSDPVHHSSGISAHVEKEHGGKTKVHFTHRGMKEEVQLDESYEKAEAHRTKAVEAQKAGNAEKFHHHMSNHYEALSQWHSSKGRHNMADLTSQKADKHHEASTNGGKLKTEEVTEEPAMKHRVAVTVSDPNHTAVSKRKDQMQKFAKVTAASMEDAIKKAEAHFKKAGFKIHGSEHHSMVKEDLNELSNDTLGSYKKKAGAEASAADKAGDTKKADKRFSGIIKATKKEFVNDLKKNESYYTKIVDALNEAMTAIDKGEYDFEGQMARTQLQTTLRNCKDLIDMVKDDDNMPEWVQSKITLAQDYITTVRDYLQSKQELGESTKAELEKDKDYEDYKDPFFEESDEEEMSDADMDAMINNTQDHEFLDAYEDNELHIIDLDTGESVEDDVEHVKEEALLEVLSRFERLRAKMRFAKTKSKRERRMAIALKSRSSTQTLNKRARHMAVILMKKRIARKPLSQLSIGEKERLDKIIQKRKVMIGRIAMKLTPRMRKIEQNRLSHTKGGTGNTNNAF
jgi:nicotinic acid mononucleotide adenylyltransferase